MLQFKGFKKYYHNFLAVEIPSFEISNGIFRLIGKNGSGKTTLLKALAGLLAFDGELILDATLLSKSPLIQRRLINYSEADPIFPPFLTGKDFLKLFAATKGGPASQLNEVISHLRVENFIRDPIGTYSSGMLKKLSIALAFIGHPKIILLDEPFANIDNDSLESVYSLINTHYKNFQTIFIIVTHQDLINDAVHFHNQFILENKTITQA